MIGDRLRRLRRDKGWTQKELGAKASVDQKNLSSYESGRLHPSPPTLRRLAEALEVTLEDLMAEETQQPTVAIADPEMLSLFREISVLPETDRKHIKWVLGLAVRQSRIQAMMASTA